MTSLPVEQTWMVLVDLLTDLKKKDMEIPSGLNKDIQLAKTTINFYKVNPTDPERMKEIKRINDLLNSVQDTLLTLADTISDDYVEGWVEKLQKQLWKSDLHILIKPRFVAGAPSGFSMVGLTFKNQF